MTDLISGNTDLKGASGPNLKEASGPLDWKKDGPFWPHSQASHFVRAAGLCWHYQRMGTGPTLLLLHGSGASTHSWRDLMEPLAAFFDVVALDLPGHAFTDRLPHSQLTLPGVTNAVATLLDTLDIHPALIVGHSAGAAVALRLTLDRRVHPKGIISLSGALKPYGGFAGPFFTGIARALVATPLVPWIAAREARNPKRTREVIQNTGSTLDAKGQALYDRLFRSKSHIAGTLGMMAGWNLFGLIKNLKHLDVPLLLVAAEKDRAISPDIAFETAKRAPDARVDVIPGLGHLAHEENPRLYINLILDEARRVGVLESNPPAEL